MTDFPWTERELRRQIVRACLALSQRGLVAATDGNVSARLGPERILVTPSGTSKGEVDELSVLLCDEEGRKIRGRGEVSSEVQVHLAAYRERPEIAAVVHAHPPLASAFTFAGMEHLFREPVIPEVAAQFGSIPTAPYATPGTRALAEAAAPFFRSSDVVLLAQHGAVTLGPDPWSAYLRMEKLEHAATILKAACELACGEANVKRLGKGQTEELLRLYGKGARAIATEDRSDGATESDEALVKRVAHEVLKRLDKAG